MAPKETLQVSCPGCKSILIVDKKTGAVLEERKPIIEESTGDRYEDAFIKVKNRASAAEEKFKKLQNEKEDKMARLNALFQDKLKEAEESGEVTKFNPLEND